MRAFPTNSRLLRGHFISILFINYLHENRAGWFFPKGPRGLVNEQNKQTTTTKKIVFLKEKNENSHKGVNTRFHITYSLTRSRINSLTFSRTAKLTYLLTYLPTCLLGLLLSGCLAICPSSCNQQGTCNKYGALIHLFTNLFTHSLIHLLIRTMRVCRWLPRRRLFRANLSDWCCLERPGFCHRHRARTCRMLKSRLVHPK